ncbi:MAG TPA: uroporphyrinogen-III synthase [Candidatus Dormibacteraeota bacterium]|nr:uroporphyrinogen-III synthase [Candidatus Dormibacteraeota bacterium]
MSEAAPSPLAGKRIVVTRAEEQSDSLLKALAGKGAVPLLLPLLEFASPEDAFPLNNAVANFAQFDWVIFTSQNGVRAVLERVTTLDPPVIPQPGKTRIAAVGPATADAIRQFGFSVDHVASSHNGLALAVELRGSLQNASVLLPRGDHASLDLPTALRDAGALVTEVVAYRTILPEHLNEGVRWAVEKGTVHAILLFSPSAVRHLRDLVGAEKFSLLSQSVVLAAIGPVTAAALNEAKAAGFLAAADTTVEAVLETLSNHFASAVPNSPAGAKFA